MVEKILASLTTNVGRAKLQNSTIKSMWLILCRVNESLDQTPIVESKALVLQSRIHQLIFFAIYYRFQPSVPISKNPISSNNNLYMNCYFVKKARRSLL